MSMLMCQQEHWDGRIILKFPSNMTEIMAMIEKRQITPKVRNHVVREVAARMLDHCLFPTKNQFEVISTKIIQEFPVLADTKIGTGYVSNPVLCIVIILILLIDSNQ